MCVLCVSARLSFVCFYVFSVNKILRTGLLEAVCTLKLSPFCRCFAVFCGCQEVTIFARFSTDSCRVFFVSFARGRKFVQKEGYYQKRICRCVVDVTLVLRGSGGFGIHVVICRPGAICWLALRTIPKWQCETEHCVRALT